MSEEIEIDTTKDTNDDNVLNLENSEFDLSLRIDHFEDEGEQIRFIKSVEKMVRRSPEYALWRNYIMDILGQTTCEITNEDASDCSVEVHHHPLNLYTIVSAVVEDRLNKHQMFSTFDIATTVIELHFQNKVGYVVMISNMHEKYHKGKLQIPIEYVRGDYKYIPQHYLLNEEENVKYLELCNLHKDQVLDSWKKGEYPGLKEEKKLNQQIENTIQTKDYDDDADIKNMLSIATASIQL